ncbi:hypothetical protein ACUODJ_16335 [Escherichia sp. HC-CC]
MLAVNHTVELALDLRLLRHRAFHQRILREEILPRIVDVTFRERIHRRLAAFQVTLIIFKQTVALR